MDGLFSTEEIYSLNARPKEKETECFYITYGLMNDCIFYGLKNSSHFFRYAIKCKNEEEITEKLVSRKLNVLNAKKIINKSMEKKGQFIPFEFWNETDIF